MMRNVTKSPIVGQSDIIANIIASGLKLENLLDIGTGNGNAARAFRDAGVKVTATGYDVDAYVDDVEAAFEGIRLVQNVDICDMHQFEDNSFDAIWCAHVLEHVFDTARALEEVKRVLKPDGYFFVSVPPFKHNVVGGHVNPGWNLGILMYVLAASGFDLSHGAFIRHGYNITAIVRKGKPLGRSLRFSNGDIEQLAAEGRFPRGFPAKQGFDGNLHSWNWTWHIEPELKEKKPAAEDLPSQAVARHASDDRPLTIGFFVPWITISRGGTENVGHMMANAMAARGHAVHIFTFDDQKGPSVWPLNESIQLHHLPTAATAVADSRILFTLAARNLDLIVGLHMNRTLLRYVRFARKLNIPVVLSEHIDPRFPRRIGSFTERERLAAFHGATRVHLLSDAFAADLPDFLQCKIAVIPNTVREADEVADPAPNVGRKVVITVARLVPRKNMSRLVEEFAAIASHVQDWDLKIIGDGPQQEALERRVTEWDMQDRIHFTGAVSDPYPHLAASQIFVLPSLFEGFPMSSLEAMAHGLPIIGYRSCNGINTQVVDAENGYLVANSTQFGTLGAAMRTLMEQAETRKRMGGNALQRFRNLYSNQNVADQWERLFQEAVDTYRGVEELPLEVKLSAFLEFELDENESG